MNFQNQLTIVRQQKHNEYINYMNNIEIHKWNESIKQKKIAILFKLSIKYKYIFNPIPIEKAVWTIQKFIRKHYFEPKCLNHNDISKIPLIYRIRITFTKNHIFKYSQPQNVEIRKIKNTVDILEKSKKMIFLFKYCFDIRDLYPIKNDIINLMNQKYILLPNDCAHVESLWNKINGSTSESIQYLNLLAYCKSLSYDKNYGYELINQNENINKIEKILEKYDEKYDEKYEDIFIININGTKIDLLFLDNLNKKYFGLN